MGAQLTPLLGEGEADAPRASDLGLLWALGWLVHGRAEGTIRPLLRLRRGRERLPIIVVCNAAVSDIHGDAVIIAIITIIGILEAHGHVAQRAWPLLVYRIGASGEGASQVVHALRVLEVFGIERWHVLHVG